MTDYSEIIEATYHVIPIDDLREHSCNNSCWCGPNTDNPKIIIHNSMDRREEYENGRKLQ